MIFLSVSLLNQTEQGTLETTTHQNGFLRALSLSLSACGSRVTKPAGALARRVPHILVLGEYLFRESMRNLTLLPVDGRVRFWGHIFRLASKETKRGKPRVLGPPGQVVAEIVVQSQS